ITAPEHHAWFARHLGSTDRILFVACSAAMTPLGQVRFERSNGTWTIGYLLAPPFRGWGLARPMLAAAIDALRARVPGAHLAAWVKPDNVASLQVFRGLGFAESQDHREGAPCLRFEL